MCDSRRERERGGGTLKTDSGGCWTRNPQVLVRLSDITLDGAKFQTFILHQRGKLLSEKTFFSLSLFAIVRR